MRHIPLRALVIAAAAGAIVLAARRKLRRGITFVAIDLEGPEGWRRLERELQRDLGYYRRPEV